ncbi:DUF4352 domain-containing protein [Kitasatospora sp. HPMI-4]|uniref:DUF4352 domain-containing protein n=1 Tax=Kitasatospora sp. HPMI-4 TaxID=3448443 RepID=UPI003F1E1032
MASTATAVRRSAALLLGAGLVVLGATACTSTGSSVSTEAKQTSAAAPAGADKKSDAPAAAKVGDTISLKGFDKANTADVTVVKIVDSPEGADEFTKPEDGKRFVAVQFKINATGTKAYSDSPANGAKLLDGQGQSFSPTFSETKAGPGFSGGTADIAPGESGMGFITFEVPKDTRIAKVQFGLDSGMAPQTGQWTVA